MPNRRIVSRTIEPAIIELAVALLVAGIGVMMLLWLLPELWQLLCMC